MHRQIIRDLLHGNPAQREDARAAALASAPMVDVDEILFTADGRCDVTLACGHRLDAVRLVDSDRHPCTECIGIPAGLVLTDRPVLVAHILDEEDV